MWAKALYSYVEHPEQHAESVVWSDAKFVVVRDKFPTARVHLLVLPRPAPDTGVVPFTGPLDFQHRSDAAVVREMLAAARAALTQVTTSAEETVAHMRFGFHMQPSMRPLHLHAISTDYDSPALRTKKHWNSFTTRFFVDAAPLAARIYACASDADVRALVQSMFGDAAAASALLSTPLRCHRCGAPMRNMPTLKSHIITCTYPLPASGDEFH